jgi:hypothetical protein
MLSVGDFVILRTYGSHQALLRLELSGTGIGTIGSSDTTNHLTWPACIRFASFPTGAIAFFLDGNLTDEQHGNTQPSISIILHPARGQSSPVHPCHLQQLAPKRGLILHTLTRDGPYRRQDDIQLFPQITWNDGLPPIHRR